MAGIRLWRIVPALIAAGLWPMPAQAQGQATPSVTTLPKLDAAGYLGWFNANKTDVATYNSWYNRSVYGGLSFGYYWNHHLKTEIDLARTSEAEVYSYEFANTPGAASSRQTEHYYRNVKVSLSQTYQFARNAWFHPFLTAGVEVDWERHWKETRELGGFRGPGGIAATRTEPRTDVHPKAVASTGFKTYLSQRTFFRTDLKFVGAKRLDQVIWRFGVGVDF